MRHFRAAPGAEDGGEKPIALTAVKGCPLAVASGERPDSSTLPEMPPVRSGGGGRSGQPPAGLKDGRVLRNGCGGLHVAPPR
jgi:hypothetical protein